MSTPNIVVTNASPIIHLARANHLNVLRDIYGKIFCSEAAAKDIKYPAEAVDFIAASATVLPITDKGLATKIQADHPKLALGEIETFVLYKELNATEALFLNTKAQNIFRQEYKASIRDIIHLPAHPDAKKTFRDENQINNFYLALASVIPEYKPLVKILTDRKLKP